MNPQDKYLLKKHINVTWH